MQSALARREIPPAHRDAVVAGVLFGARRGLDSHGVPLFKVYLQELDSGRAKTAPVFRYSGRGAARVLDADDALGMVAGAEATRTASELAQAHGVGVVSVRRSNHFGAASIYASSLADLGMVGLVMSNSDALVVPHGGVRPLLGTNPIAFAAPGTGAEQLCADLATSQGSFLKHLAPARSGKPVAAGLVTDRHGRDVAETGEPPFALMPVGGYKGQCLGMMVSVLCALLSGERPDWELVNMYQEPFDEGRHISHFFMAMDLTAFGDRTLFRTRLSDLTATFRSSPGRAGQEVKCPGDLERAAEADRRANGVPISPEDYDLLASS